MRGLTHVLGVELHPQKRPWFGGQNVDPRPWEASSQMLILSVFGPAALSKLFNVNFSYP